MRKMQLDLRIEHFGFVIRSLHHHTQIGRSNAQWLGRTEDADRERSGLLAQHQSAAIGEQNCRSNEAEKYRAARLQVLMHHSTHLHGLEENPGARAVKGNGKCGPGSHQAESRAQFLNGLHRDAPANVES